MRKFFPIVTGLFFVFLFTACTQYSLNVETYLSYWASEAYVKAHAVKAVQHYDKDSVLCVPSASDVAVTLTLHNPKNFPLVMPTSSDNAAIVIRFPDLDPQPQYSTDYTLDQTAPDTLLLVYKSAFLQEYEWGSKDIGAEITLSSQDKRVFKQKYRFKLKANTPPPAPRFTVAKTTGSPSHYVLCLTVPDMDKQVQKGLLHNDLVRIDVNGTSYPFSVNKAENRFEKPASDVFITQSEVEKLSEPNPDEVPVGGWVLYYKTDAEVKDGAAKKDYTITLADEKGLVCTALNASTQPNRPKLEAVNITKGTVSGSGSGSEADPIIIATDSTGAEIRISSETANATVHITLTTMESGTAAEYTGNPVTVQLPLNGVGEKKYKLEYYTDGEGFTATPRTTVFYTVVQGYTVTFDANGGAYPDSSPTVSQTALSGGTITAPNPLPTKEGYMVTGWYKDAACSSGQEWNFTTGTVTSDIRLYAKWVAGSGTKYTVKHYQETVEGTYTSPQETEELNGVTNAELSVSSGTITPKTTYTGFTYVASLTKINGTVQATGTIKPDGSTVVELYYKRNVVTVTFNPNGGTIDSSTSNVIRTGRFGTVFTAPANPVWTGHTFSGWDPTLPTSPTFPAEDKVYTAKWDVSSYTVTYGVTGGNGTIKTDSGTAVENGEVHVVHGTHVTFEAIPNSGYEVDSWTGVTPDASPADKTKATLSNVTAHKTVTVTFKKKTTIIESSGSVQPYEPSPYTFELDPNSLSFTQGGSNNKITFTLKKKPSESGGTAQPLAPGTQFTLTMELYQNGSSLASLGDGKGIKTGTQHENGISITLPAYLPAGTYQLHLKAEVGGQVYDGWRTVTVN